MKSVNLLRIKEFTMDNLSSINMDFLSPKEAKCKQTEFPLLYSIYPNFILCGMKKVSASSDGSNEALSSDTTKSNALRRILFSFSWRRNFAILFSEQPKNCISDVIEIAGLRVLCLLWILLVHICTVLYYVAGEFNYITIIMIFQVLCSALCNWI